MSANYFKLTAQLSKITLSGAEKNEIEEALKEICENKEEQINFFLYCKNWKLAPWICSQLRELSMIELFSQEIQDQFVDFYDNVKKANEARNAEAIKILTAFKKNNIDVVILKGNLFIHTIYQDIGYKRMNDFDMLIHPEDWPKVQEIYFELGYIPLGFGWSGEKQKAAKFSHAGMSFISPNFNCITGTQWGIKSPTSKYTVDMQDLWQTTTEFDFYGEKVKQLSPEYNILHLVLHLGVYKCGTRDCMDIYNLFLSDYKINEDKLVEIINKSNAREKAYFTFSLSNLCSENIPSSILQQIKPDKKSFLVGRMESRIKMVKETGDLHNSYNDYFHNIEMCVFYFNLFPSFHIRAALYFKLIWLILWPNKIITKQLSDITKHSTVFAKIAARIKAPYFVLALTAEEIGWSITFLLLAKFFIDTIFSIKNYFIKKESYFDYLRSRGINPDAIKQEVKKIQ